MDHHSPQWTQMIDTSSALEMCTPEQAPALEQLRALGCFVGFAPLYVCPVNHQRNNCTGESAGSEENARVLSPELLSDHSSAIALLHDSKQVIPSLSASHFSQALQPVSSVHEVFWAAVSQWENSLDIVTVIKIHNFAFSLLISHLPSPRVTCLTPQLPQGLGKQGLHHS